MRIGILASRGLGYKVLSDLSKQIEKPVFIASDIKSEYIIEFANKNSLHLFTGNPMGGKLVEFLNNYQIEVELILSINYLFLLDDELIVPDIIIEAGTMWTDNTSYIEISDMEAQDIDIESDWKLAELKYSYNQNSMHPYL